MKKVNITVSYDEEKLSAIKLYMEQKDLSLDDELGKAVDTLYNKHVPVNVRDFLGLRNGDVKKEVKSKKPKPVIQQNTDTMHRGDQG